MINTLKDIDNLLLEFDEREWSMSFQKFISLYSSSTENDALKSEIRGIYGGMGSFNDLVLYKDGKACIEENTKLDHLRKKLFREIT